MAQTERSVYAGPAARGLTVMVERIRSQNCSNLQNTNKWELARQRMGRRVFGVGGTAQHSDRQFHT